VTQTGALYKASGAASSSHPSTGTYLINFSASIRNCAYLATAGQGADIMETIGSERYGGPVEQVEVREFNSTGSLTDGRFDLGVFC
jgi:hypothetical protein